MLSKPGSNNLYLKVPPPSIGIGQQCINAFGYHGNSVATTYEIPLTGYYTLHYTVLLCILLLNPPTTPKFMPMYIYYLRAHKLTLAPVCFVSAFQETSHYPKKS